MSETTLGDRSSSGRTSTGNKRIAIVGCGNWGRNLVRNMYNLKALAAVCDDDAAAGAAQAERFHAPLRTYSEILEDKSIPAVGLVVPADQHYPMARRALEAGKHVFVEKPLALRHDDGADLVALARRQDRVLMVGHLMQYHPAFLALKALVEAGELGQIRYIYSNRLNFGTFRKVENVFWSFAPHDISMILSLTQEEPEQVRAIGAAYLQEAVADVTTTHLSFPSGVKAHLHVSWLHPFKEQKLVVVGEKAMAVFNDRVGWEEKLQIFRHSIVREGNLLKPIAQPPESVALVEAEPLEQECRHFLDCVAEGKRPRTDGAEGLRVLDVLEQAENTMTRVSGTVPASRKYHEVPAEPDVFVHETACIDQPSVIGEGTKVWHFSHVLPGTRIGRNCTLGQNVMVGPDVSVGDDCKIQNNVSLYKGVVLEDGVFCGPSCVFTNVDRPRAEIDRSGEFLPTLVKRGATVGANATIVCGTTLGAYSFVAAGAVVTRDVPAHAVVAGVPAQQIGWSSHAGDRLGADLVCPREGRRYQETDDGQLEEILEPTQSHARA